MFLKVIFEMDGAGIEYSPHEPIHLDGLLSWCLVEKSPEYTHDRDGQPTELDLPLKKWESPEDWCWKASALAPEGWNMETIRYVRRHFDVGLSTLCAGKPNTIGLRYKDRNDPHTFQIVTALAAYADTEEPEIIQRELHKLKYLGRGVARGNGRIQKIRFEEADDDFSVIKNGIVARYLPHPKGWKFVRCRPEYWRTLGRVHCFTPGDVLPQEGTHDLRRKDES